MTSEGPVLHHVNLKTTRMQEMIDWYAFAVGMEPSWIAADACWLTNDAANHRLALLAVPGLSDDPDKIAHTGMHHLAFEYDSYDALLGAYERLLDDGIAPALVPRPRHDDVVLLRRPRRQQRRAAGRQLRRLGEVQGVDAHRAEFAADPIGVPVDPDSSSPPARRRRRRRAPPARLRGEFKPDSELDLRLPR